MAMKATTEASKSLKILKKSARKCRSHLNHNVFLENIIYDPVNVFPTQLGIINIRINYPLSGNFKGNHQYKRISKIFKKITKTRFIEVIKLIVKR